jgi:hypothetical protein
MGGDSQTVNYLFTGWMASTKKALQPCSEIVSCVLEDTGGYVKMIRTKSKISLLCRGVVRTFLGSRDRILIHFTSCYGGVIPMD